MPELALRFILANPDVSTIIPGMRRKLHVETNLGVSDGSTLAPDVLERLRKHRWVRTYFVP
jgi:aryl-alcohol dehydrogenase-like predicted oxidoreductase